ncbi:MAG: T9SS type A sorting domain-containing protein, partial [Bacteroidota bacterium]
PKTTVDSEVGALGPNPASHTATLAVSLAAPADVRVMIYDALGRRVATPHDGPLAEGPHRLALPVSQLAAGTYVIRVEGIGTSTTRRLTVTR